MNLRQLEYFMQLAELGSFTRASVVLGVAQPSLSRHVRLLEAELRATLFRRHGRGVELTAEGRSFLEHASRAKQAIGDGIRALEELRASPQGHIVVGLPSRIAGVAAAPLVRLFRSQFPDAAITVAEGLSTTLQEWLLLGRVNVAILLDPPPNADLEVELLLTEELVLVGPAQTANRQASEVDSISIERLGEYPLILPRTPNATRNVVERAAAKAGINLNITAEVDTVQNILELVAGRLGYAILPRGAVRKAGKARVHTIAIKAPGLRQSLFLATSGRQPKTALAKHVQHMIRESRLSELLA